MAIILAPKLSKKINLEHSLKIALFHDLAEIITGDIPINKIYSSKIIKMKQINEKKAIKKLIKQLDPLTQNEIFNSWKEFEENITYEAKFINALDKIEAQLQQNKIKDIQTLKDLQKSNILNKINYLFSFDDYLYLFMKIVLQEAIHLRGKNEEKTKKNINKH